MRVVSRRLVPHKNNDQMTIAYVKVGAVSLRRKKRKKMRSLKTAMRVEDSTVWRLKRNGMRSQGNRHAHGNLLGTAFHCTPSSPALLLIGKCRLGRPRRPSRPGCPARHVPPTTHSALSPRATHLSILTRSGKKCPAGLLILKKTILITWPQFYRVLFKTYLYNWNRGFCRYENCHLLRNVYFASLIFLGARKN